MLVESIGEPAALEQLAEECLELAHACLKLARVERKENPTPKTREECEADVIEEWADVILCMGEMTDCEWTDGEAFDRVYDEKMARMKERIRQKQQEKQQEKQESEGVPHEDD